MSEKDTFSDGNGDRVLCLVAPVVNETEVIYGKRIEVSDVRVDYESGSRKLFVFDYLFDDRNMSVVDMSIRNDMDEFAGLES